MAQITFSTVTLLVVTVMIHAVGTTQLIRGLILRFADPDGRFRAHNALPAVIWAAVTLLILHVVEILLWALAYVYLIPDHQLDTYEKAAYFSFVTFTTLGIRRLDAVGNWLAPVERH
jgi:hypothetical protein